MKIDEEWYTVPGNKIVALDGTFCSIKFGGQSINVEKSALVRCSETSDDAIETDAYEVRLKTVNFYREIIFFEI